MPPVGADKPMATKDKDYPRWKDARSASSSGGASASECAGSALPASVHVVDDDKSTREALGNLLRSMGYVVALHQSASHFLNAELPDAPTCLVVDVRMPGTSGLELQAHLNRLNVGLPVVLITAFGDVPMSVAGMKAGAVDFLTKPVRDQDLLDAIAAAIRADHERRKDMARVARLRERYAQLTTRERQVTALVASGLMNKQVAHELSISEVTVKMHRGRAMQKLGVRSLAKLVPIATLLDIPISRGSSPGPRYRHLSI
jgi:FixJ family two-component response regulator